MTDEVHFRLTKTQQEAIKRLLSEEWKPIGESVKEIVVRLDRRLDADWIAEYLAFHNNKEN